MKVKKHKKARGSIIGKALSKLTNEGYVLIMLSLQ
jgi:ribosomal protein S19E (S16A)